MSGTDRGDLVFSGFGGFDVFFFVMFRPFFGCLVAAI